MVESFLGVVGRNWIFTLGKNFAAVKFRGHFDSSDAKSGFPLKDCPFDRETASVVRQKRGVEIDSHKFGEFKPDGGEKKAVTGGDNKVGRREGIWDSGEVGRGEDRQRVVLTVVVNR